MLRPKITIRKKFILDAKGHYRYFPANYNPVTKQRSSVTINLDASVQYSPSGYPYPQAIIRTEKELMLFLLQNWGYGDYIIFGHLKGRSGTFVFWRGEINRDGYIFEAKEYSRKEITSLETQYAKAETDAEKQQILNDINEWKEINKDESKVKRYGFLPFLRSSGKRGIWHNWDEADEAFDENIRELNKVPSKKNNKELTISEMNNF